MKQEILPLTIKVDLTPEDLDLLIVAVGEYLKQSKWSDADDYNAIYERLSLIELHHRREQS